MNHKVNNVAQLYSDAEALLTNVVKGTADTVLSELSKGVQNLKDTWKGKDAGVQIMNVINVYNAMVKVRNSLGNIAVASSKVACTYRDIQIANGASFEELAKLMFEEMTAMEGYTDVADTVDIKPEAEMGKKNIDAAVDAMNTLLSQARDYNSKILGNWTAGGEDRDYAVTSFEEFISKANTYSQTLGEVSQSIATALTNYNF